jgi:hypothetical protein
MATLFPAPARPSAITRAALLHLHLPNHLSRSTALRI